MIGVRAFRAGSLFVQIMLLTATSLRAQTAGTVFGTIVSAQTNAPIQGVAVRVAGGQQVATTRGDGTFRLRLPPGRYELEVTAIGFAPLTHDVTIMEESSARLDFALHSSAVRIDEVVTIGTRRHDRTVTQSPVPIDVITSEAMEATGLVETWQMLQRLVPSVNVPHFPRGDDHMRPITLRGLAPDQVLVLVNGKRRHSAAVIQGGPVLSGSTAVDLNGSPSGAIERIEVLRDGAAAQY
nr:TonB-dependent receptor [Gemmatimonadota bacterium]